MVRLTAALLLLSTSFAFADDTPGHSKHGSAFDSGMRTRPWLMKGIGESPFAIMTKNPEVQKWFDQGTALLHSFWFEEAERSFRWCLKLEPENPMAYWGMARCGLNWFSIGSAEFDGKDVVRFTTFLKEAVKRKENASPRERMYIEAWEKAFAPGEKNRTKVMVARLQEIVIACPMILKLRVFWRCLTLGKGVLLQTSCWFSRC